MNKHISLLIFAGLLCSTISIFSISNKIVVALTGFSMAGAAVGSYKLSEGVQKFAHKKWPSKIKCDQLVDSYPYVFDKRIWAAIGAIVAGSAIAYKLYQYTPRARYNRAQNMVKDISGKILATQELDDENRAYLLRAAGHLSGGNTIPYIQACRELGVLDTQLNMVKNETAKAQRDISKNGSLAKKLFSLNLSVECIDRVITHNLGYIQLQDPKLFADLLAKDAQSRQADAQGKMADAQGTMAKAQTSQEVRGWIGLLGKLGGSLGKGLLKVLSFPLKVITE